MPYSSHAQATPCAAAGTDHGQQSVARVLQPVMWRNTKHSVQSEGAGFQPKHHHLVRLHFDSPEWTFYEDAVSEVRDLVREVETVEEALADVVAIETPMDPSQAKGRMFIPSTGSCHIK